MRLLTINLLHGGFVPGMREETAQTAARLRLLADEMVRLRPDVVTVQEALVASRHGAVATWLAARLGYEVRFAKANPFILPPPLADRLPGALRTRIDRVIAGMLDFEEGTATLTSLPIVSHAVHALPRPSFPLENRVALRVRLAAAAGPLDVWNVHLTRAGGGHRRQATALVALVARESAGVPAIVLGDFNVSEETDGIQTLRAAGFVDVFRRLHPADAGLTAWQQVDVPTPTVSRRVDYCWLAPGTALSALDSTVVFDHPRSGPGGRPLWPSDHYGLLTELAA
jgi:endonuclease/exonuclease/phosphatase family metal-dependent hydrolase